MKKVLVFLVMLLPAAFISMGANNHPIIIDAAHGGKASGATSPCGIHEKDIVLSIIHLLQKEAAESKHLNLIFTRESDQFLTFDQRLEIADSNLAEVFISLHLQAGYSTKSNGFSFIVPEDSAFRKESEELAELFVREFGNLEGVQVNKLFQHGSHKILKDNKRPAIILNLGNLLNADDLSFIQDTDNQKLVCRSIIQAIEKSRQF